MTHRTTISLESQNYEFLNSIAGHNRSSYINELLARERLKTLRDAVLSANIEEAEDAEYQEEIGEWDSTLEDGLNSDDV